MKTIFSTESSSWLFKNNNSFCKNVLIKSDFHLTTYSVIKHLLAFITRLQIQIFYMEISGEVTYNFVNKEFRP